MQRRVQRRTLVVNHLHGIHARRRRFVDELAAGHGGVVGTVGLGFGEAPVDQVGLRKRGVEHHVEQAALAAREHGGHAGDRRRQRAVGADHAQAAGAFSHEHLAAWKEGQAPGILQALGHRDHVEGHVRLRFRGVGLARQRRLLLGSDGGARVNALRRSNVCGAGHRQDDGGREQLNPHACLRWADLNVVSGFSRIGIVPKRRFYPTNLPVHRHGVVEPHAQHQ